MENNIFESLIVSMLKSRNKIMILIVLCTGERTITQLQKEIGCNYKTVWLHVQSMDKTFVTINKKVDQTGQPVFVKLNNLLVGQKGFKKKLIKKLKQQDS